MLRRKLTDEEKLAAALIKQEEHRLSLLERILAELRASYINAPTYFFQVGDLVHYGNISTIVKSLITEVRDSGKIYKIHCTMETPVYGKIVHSQDDRWIAWYDLEPILSEQELKTTPQLSYRDDIDVQFYSKDVECILFTHYHFGIETETDYQRGNVWSHEQKVELIDSIFNNVQIGSLVLLHRDYKSNQKAYEIIDGKQRFLALMDFKESRFTYKGLLYRQMQRVDRNHFDMYRISCGEVKNLTWPQILKLFLKLNTCGKPQEQSHLMKVRNILEISTNER